MALPSDELHDIADPAPYLPGIEVPLWFWIALATVLLAATSCLLFVILRRKPPPAPPDLSFYGQSRHTLERLRESLGGRSLAEVATDASLIMRHYLEVTMQEPALYETHEEFLLRPDALEELPAGARQRLAPLLDQLARAKYTPSPHDEEAAHELVDSCLTVLQGLESTRKRQIA